MTSKEALKRLWQETAPATYMKDFDKKECCDVIERDLEMLEIVKKFLLNTTMTEEEYEKFKEWLNNENDR